jgi:hypothetical protein
MTKHWLAWIFLGALSQGGLQAAETLLPASSLAFPSIQEGGGARAIGMGSTYVGIAEGSASLLWNPAGLSGLQNPEFAIHHQSGLVGAIQEIAVVGLPLGNGNGLGISLNYEDNGVFDGRDLNGASTGDFTSRTYGASLGWGISIPDGFSLGLTIKANQEDLDGSDLNALAGDAGVLWAINPDVSLGAAYTNLGPAVNGEQLAQGLRVGLSSYICKDDDLQWLLAVSGESLTNSDNSVHLGAEVTFYQLLSLRTGYAFGTTAADSTGSNDLLGWTFGGGIIIQSFALDFAYVPLSDLGSTQRVSLTYVFGDRCVPAAGTDTPRAKID